MTRKMLVSIGKLRTFEGGHPVDGSRCWETKQSLSKQQSATYQGAFEAVLAVPIAIGFGFWCDRSFDTAPVGLLIGTVVGFAAMLLRIVRMRPGETGEEPDPAGENTAPHNDQDRDQESDR
jgi:F0F1-type ATP synthase assembly protein I